MLMGIILIQKSKGSLGIGSIGSGMQMLFGGSGGQDLLQKLTWALGAIFMASCLGLSIYKSRVPSAKYASSKYTQQAKTTNAPATQGSENTEA